MLWLNPTNPDSFPDGFMDALDDPVLVQLLQRQQRPHDSIEGRLRARIQAEKLQPLTSLEDEETPDPSKEALTKNPYSEEDLKEAVQFLRLNVRVHILQSGFTPPTDVRSRCKIGYSSFLITCGRDMPTAFGAVPNTRTRTTWRLPVLDPTKNHTTETAPFARIHDTLRRQDACICRLIQTF